MKKFATFILALCISSIASAQFISYEPNILGGSFNYDLVYDQEFYYPPEASNYEGTVEISFYVDINGYASNFIIEQSVHPLLDSAYVEVLERFFWIPGTHDGAASKMQMKMSEKFKYKKYIKLVKRRGYDIPPFKHKPYNPSLDVIKFGDLETKAKSYYKNEEVNIFKFISQYIKVPDAAVKQGIKGVVELEFIIEPSGRLSNFNAIKGIGGGCTEEAIRLMRMLDWEPGKMGKEYTRSCYRIKVNFGNTRY